MLKVIQKVFRVELEADPQRQHDGEVNQQHKCNDVLRGRSAKGVNMQMYVDDCD